MNREKQIEEMAKVIENGINICAKKPCEDCVFCGADDCMCQNLVIAKELHTAGYRKSTEVARDALYLINELTEENERLRADNKMVSKRTVRKFVKMLKSHDCRCDSCINEIKKEIENEN